MAIFNSYFDITRGYTDVKIPSISRHLQRISPSPGVQTRGETPSLRTQQGLRTEVQSQKAKTEKVELTRKISSNCSIGWVHGAFSSKP